MALLGRFQLSQLGRLPSTEVHQWAVQEWLG